MRGKNDSDDHNRALALPTYPDSYKKVRTCLRDLIVTAQSYRHGWGYHLAKGGGGSTWLKNADRFS